MLGDVGYGIIVTAIGFAIKQKFKTGGLNAIALILMFSGVLSTIFGVVYGEFFGFPIFNIVFQGHPEEGILGIAGPAIAGIHFPIHRFDSVKPLLLLCFAIGIFHVLLGYIIGFRNEAVKHDIKHAIYAKGSWMMILIGGVLLIAKVMPALMSKSPMQTGDMIFLAGAGLMLIGVILLIKGEGFISILELPTLLSNVLSYSRILAIGLSSAGIALAVNTMSMDLFIRPKGVLLGGGIVLALAGVLILFIGHLINLLLGILGPGIHSLRLQYVEFFTKFYEGGGTKYLPFGHKRKYTEEKKEMISKLPAEKNQKILKSIIEKNQSGNSKIYSRSKDKSIVSKMTKLEFAGEIDCIGGIVMENADGSVVLDFKYDMILKNVSEQSLKQVSDILFG